MHTNLFPLFEQFQGRLQIAFFDKEDAVRQDKECAEKMGYTNYAGLHQVHGNRTVITREPSHSTEQADGMITDTKELVLCSRSADCQTFVVFAPKKHVVGVLHAGWKGMNAQAITAFYTELKNEWGIEPADTFVAAAPSLSKQCAEFTDPATELPNIDPQFFEGRLVDLQAAADFELLMLGVPEEQIDRVPACTVCNAETLWSYRGGDRDAVINGDRNVLCAVLL